MGYISIDSSNDGQPKQKEILEEKKHSHIIHIHTQFMSKSTWIFFSIPLHRKMLAFHNNHWISYAFHITQPHNNTFHKITGKLCLRYRLGQREFSPFLQCFWFSEHFTWTEDAFEWFAEDILSPFILKISTQNPYHIKCKTGPNRSMALRISRERRKKITSKLISKCKKRHIPKIITIFWCVAQIFVWRHH